MAIAEPTSIPRAWASASNGRYEEIPDTTEAFGRASWSLGFPVDTATPLKAGGIPPNWLDMQGVLNALSQHVVFGQSGGRYAWVNDRDFPAGACIIGSNGIVYQALQESGPGVTGVGAKDPTLAANSAYWGALATPDGTTIVLDGNGKLSVSSANLATLLADGTTIVVDNGKLKSLASGTDANSLADNQTTVANGTKLSVNLTDAPALALKNITQYLIKTGAGLAMDQTTGKLLVDFASMPKEDFERMASGLHLPIWVGERGVDTEFYVSPSGTDTFGDGWGESETKPWQSIGFATEQICQNYNISDKTCHINVAAGTYNEYITLPMQQRTSGKIIIRPKSNSDIVNIFRSISGSGYGFAHSGGVWEIHNMNIKITLEEQSRTTGTDVVNLIRSTDQTGELMFVNCNFAFDDQTKASTTQDPHSAVEAIMFNVSGGYVRLKNSSAGSANATTWSGTQVNASVIWIQATNGGIFAVEDSGTSSNSYYYNVSGKFDVFCKVTQHAMYKHQGTGSIPVWNAATGTRGQRYQVLTGGSITTGSGSPSTYFPGNTAGTVQSSTYSWIA